MAMQILKHLKETGNYTSHTIMNKGHHPLPKIMAMQILKHLKETDNYTGHTIMNKGHPPPKKKKEIERMRKESVYIHFRYFFFYRELGKPQNILDKEVVSELRFQSGASLTSCKIANDSQITDYRL